LRSTSSIVCSTTWLH